MARAAKPKPASRRTGRARAARKGARPRRRGAREAEGRSRTAAAGRGRKPAGAEEKDLPTGEEFLH